MKLENIKRHSLKWLEVDKITEKYSDILKDLQKNNEDKFLK